MKIASVISTKGGPGKTTVTANLGAFCAEANPTRASSSQSVERF